jgi:D-alanine-D-alanine ligase
MLFGLTGYARVDFRVDPEGKPYILEVNPNPCLEPDAGFAAACEQAGMTYEDLIAHVVNAAVQG